MTRRCMLRIVTCLVLAGCGHEPVLSLDGVAPAQARNLHDERQPASRTRPHVDRAILAGLRQQLRSNDRSKVAEALSEAFRLADGGRELAPDVVAVVHRNGPEQYLAAKTLGRLGATDELMALIRQDTGLLRLRALYGLLLAPASSVALHLPAIHTLTNDPDPKVRAYAACVIARATPDDAAVVPRLVAVLRDNELPPRSLARCDVIQILGSLGPRAAPAVPELIRSLNPGDPVRGKMLLAHAAALNTIGTPPAIEALVHTMHAVSKRNGDQLVDWTKRQLDVNRLADDQYLVEDQSFLFYYQSEIQGKVKEDDDHNIGGGRPDGRRNEPRPVIRRERMCYQCGGTGQVGPFGDPYSGAGYKPAEACRNCYGSGRIRQ